MQKWSWRYRVAMCLSLLGGGIIGYFVFTKTPFNDYSFVIDAQLASEFGDFIGGFVGPIFSLAGVFLLFETLIYQRKSFNKQQFENKFFELLKMHRENVIEMKYSDIGKKELYGRDVFVEMRNKFGDIYKMVQSIIKLSEQENINIAYLILFFGMGLSSNHVLEEYLYKQITSEQKKYIDDILFEVGFKSADTVGREDGFHSNLGHYFRHLFQMVKFVDNEKSLSTTEKYFYIKTIRAQLSNHEITIFFFNSLSIFGRAWSSGDVNLIEKYHFIKNMPINFAFQVDPKKYYPKIEYEFDEV